MIFFFGMACHGGKIPMLDRHTPLQRTWWIRSWKQARDKSARLVKIWFFSKDIRMEQINVSKNRGTPKSSILKGVFHYKPSILGYHIFGKRLNGEWEFDGRGCCKLWGLCCDYIYLLESVGRCGDRIDVVFLLGQSGVCTRFFSRAGHYEFWW